MDDINYPWATACEENGGNIDLPDPNKAISSSTAEVKGQQSHSEAEQPEKREDMSDKNTSAAAEMKGQQSETEVKEGVGAGTEDDPKGAAGERKKKREKAQGVTGGAGAYTESVCDKSREGMKSQLKFFVGQWGCEGGELGV